MKREMEKEQSKGAGEKELWVRQRDAFSLWEYGQAGDLTFVAQSHEDVPWGGVGGGGGGFSRCRRSLSAGL